MSASPPVRTWPWRADLSIAGMPFSATRRFNRSGSSSPINEVRARQYNAAITGLIGIAPQDEIEGMIAAQLIAAHNATMECYRRAMIGEQTLEGRRDKPQPSEQVSRTYAVLLDALNPEAWTMDY